MYTAHENIDRTFYQTEHACIPTLLLQQSIRSSEANFRQMRDYLNDTRCRMLTQLVERNITGVELIRAFEQAPNLIEKMYMYHSNRHNDDFITQLVNVTHCSVIESPHRCEPPPQRPPVSETKLKPPLKRSPLPSPVKVNEPPPPSIPIPDPSPPPKDIISSPSLPRLSSYHSVDEQPLTMGYQWKGEDN